MALFQGSLSTDGQKPVNEGKDGTLIWSNELPFLFVNGGHTISY